MDQQTQPRSSGSYTANLLGNIRSRLTGFQGYGVMALELIQNADGAKAESVVLTSQIRVLLSSIAASSPTAVTCIRT